VEAEQKLLELEQKRQAYKDQVAAIYEKEKQEGVTWQEKSAMMEERQVIHHDEKKLEKSILHQRNVVRAYQAGSFMKEVTDDKGTVNENIPDFTPIPTKQIAFDEETILTDQPHHTFLS
jgi:hypothetical protein